MDNFKPLQAQDFSLAGSGCVIGATSITLKSFTTIDGTPIAMTDLGTIAYMTLEPGSGTLEEQISFAGVTQNANGTATLTTVKTVLFEYPYTQTAGVAKTHAGSTVAVLSNTSGFYDEFLVKDNDETITGTWTFPDDDVTNARIASDVDTTIATAFVTLGQLSRQAISGAANASTTVKGIVELATQAEVDARSTTGATGALLVPTPERNRTVLTHDSITSAVGTDAYAITCVPAVTAYTSGDVYYFKADVANTGACTLNVNALGAKALKMNGNLDPVDGYIKVGSQVCVQYDGTNMQILSVSGKPSVSQTGEEIYGASGAGTDTYAVTLVPAPVAYVNGMTVRFKADVVNTGAATLNVNGLGAIAIEKNDGFALATGDIAALQIVEVIYNSTGPSFDLVSTPLPTYAFGVATELNVNGVTQNNDLTITTGFTPRLITLTYFLQGGDAGSYKGIKGIATFNGTSLVAATPIWGLHDGVGSTLSGDDGTISSFVGYNTVAVTNSALLAAGDNSAGANDISVALAVNSVSSTNFVIRRATVAGSGVLVARAKIYYEAWA